MASGNVGGLDGAVFVNTFQIRYVFPPRAGVDKFVPLVVLVAPVA